MFCGSQVLKKTVLKKDHRDSFSHYYVPNVDIKDFNVLTDGKNFFNLPVRDEVKFYRNIIEMSRNNDYTTGNAVDFAYFKENYRPIATALSKQTKSKDPQRINFIGRLLAEHGETMFFIMEKSEETTLKFLQNSANII